MKRILVLGMLAALTVPVAQAGVVIETVTRDAPGGKVTPSTRIYVQGDAARMEEPDGGVSIFRGDRMIEIDKEERSYRVIDKAAIAAMAQQFAAMQQAQKARVAKMPPAERAQFEKLAAPKPHVSLTLVDTGRSDSVDGRSCHVWQTKRGSELENELCVIPYSSLPGKGEVQALFRNLGRFFDEMAQQNPLLGQGAGQYFRAFGGIDGFPVRTRSFTNGKPDADEDIVKSWKEQALPAALFEPPAGFRQAKAGLGDDDEK
jgi:hypothetical protein